MGHGPVALTGPAAAAALGLDGFRGVAWPELWCVPHGSRPRGGRLRVRAWSEPSWIDGVPVAAASLVLRHLGMLDLRCGNLVPEDRVEFAVEHALRLGLVSLADLAVRGTGRPSESLLRHVIARRPPGEPPTESYAETRAVQRFRQWGLVVWRQVPIHRRGRVVHRADFGLSLGRRTPPEPILPKHALLIEIDSREFHEQAFEADHARESVYDSLGYHWVSFTPNQIEHRPGTVLGAIDGALGRIGTCRARLPRP